MIEQENGIKTKSASSGNPQANATIDRIYQILGNLVRTYNLQETYVDNAEPWIGILAAAHSSVRIMYHWTKKNPGPVSVWVRHDTPNQ